MATQIYGQSALGAQVGGGARNKAELDLQPLYSRINEIIRSLERSASDDVTGPMYTAVDPEKVVRALPTVRFTPPTDADIRQAIDKVLGQESTLPTIEDAMGGLREDATNILGNLPAVDVTSFADFLGAPSMRQGGEQQDVEVTPGLDPQKIPDFASPRLADQQTISGVPDFMDGTTAIESTDGMATRRLTQKEKDEIARIREEEARSGQRVSNDLFESDLSLEDAIVAEEMGRDSFDPTRGRYPERPILMEETIATPSADATSVDEPAGKRLQQRRFAVGPDIDIIGQEEGYPLLPGPIGLVGKAKDEEEAFDPTRGRYQERPILMEETIVTPSADAEAEVVATPTKAGVAPMAANAVGLPADAGPGILERLAGLGGKIGQLVRENPDLVLQGLRTIGELGGEYKRGRREQEAADRAAQEARMATAISALTRGRVNPMVVPSMPRTTAGEGMFDVLAGIGRGGQEFMSQKRALEEQERLEAMQDEEIARTRRLEDEATQREIDAIAAEEEERRIQKELDRERLELERYDAQTRRMAVTGEEDDDPEAVELKKQVDDAAMIMAHVSGLLETYKKGDFLTTGAIAGYIGDRNYDPFGEAPRIQQDFDSQKLVLFNFMKKIGDLGRLSDRDAALIEQTIPDKFTGKQRLQGAYDGIAKLLNRKTKGAFEAGPSPFEKGYDPEKNMRLLRGSQAISPQATSTSESVSEEYLETLADRAYDDEGNLVDEEALAELKRLDSRVR